MSLTTTRAPSSAMRSQVRAPIPDPPPVTMAVLPANLMCSSPLHRRVGLTRPVAHDDIGRVPSARGSSLEAEPHPCGVVAADGVVELRKSGHSDPDHRT